MSTYGHHQRAALGFGGQAAVGTRHAAANTMGVILAAIVVGVLIALLIAVAIGGPAATGVHRAGAHGRVTTMHRLQAGAAGVATATFTAAPGLSARAANQLRLRERLMSGEYSSQPLAIRRLHHTARA